MKKLLAAIALVAMTSSASAGNSCVPKYTVLHPEAAPISALLLPVMVVFNVVGVAADAPFIDNNLKPLQCTTVAMAVHATGGKPQN